MKKLICYCAFFAVLLSCSDDEKAIDFVEENITYGSVIRTLGFAPADLIAGDPSSNFKVMLEQQDFENGGLLAAMRVYVSFVDNTPGNGLNSTQETFLTTYLASDFSQGATGLPRLDLEYSFLDLLNITGLTLSQTACTDQFLIRVEVELTDERTFTVGSGASCIIAYETFFSSPYRYLVNIVEPLPEDLFTGTYRYTSVLDGPFGGTFGPTQLVEITAGANRNVREIRFLGTPESPTNGRPRPFFFSLACNQAVFWENQLRKNNANCREGANDILLGPGPENAPITPLEDSVFELWLVEGYLGFDGSLGFGTQPSRVRFDKQ